MRSLCRGGFETSGIGHRRTSLSDAEAIQRPSGETASEATMPPPTPVVGLAELVLTHQVGTSFQPGKGPMSSL